MVDVRLLPRDARELAIAGLPARLSGGPCDEIPLDGQGALRHETIANRLLDIYQRGDYRGYVTRARAKA